MRMFVEKLLDRKFLERRAGVAEVFGFRPDTPLEIIADYKEEQGELSIAKRLRQLAIAYRKAESRL